MSDNPTTEPEAPALSDAHCFNAAEKVVRSFCDANSDTDEDGDCTWPHCGCELRPKEAFIRHCGAAADEIERLRGAIKETCAMIAKRVDESSDQVTDELVDIFYHPILELAGKANGN